MIAICKQKGCEGVYGGQSTKMAKLSDLQKKMFLSNAKSVNFEDALWSFIDSPLDNRAEVVGNKFYTYKIYRRFKD